MLEATARHMPSNPGRAHPRFGGDFANGLRPLHHVRWGPTSIARGYLANDATRSEVETPRRGSPLHSSSCNNGTRAVGQLLFTPEAGA